MRALLQEIRRKIGLEGSHEDLWNQRDRCDGGTLFSRRDSFVTYRAFCDALAEENVRVQTLAGCNGGVASSSSPPQPPLTPSTSVVSPTLSIQSSEIPENPTRQSPPSSNATCLVKTVTNGSSSNCASTFSSVFASVVASSSSAAATSQSAISTSTFSQFDVVPNVTHSDSPTAISTMSVIKPHSFSFPFSLLTLSLLCPFQLPPQPLFYKQPPSSPSLKET